jgi:2Fe-2S ferredoxin
MSTITYITPEGSKIPVVATVGSTVMQTAVRNGVPGIIAECGGQAMCATCHVYVRLEDLAALPEISDDEEEMLECTAADRTSASRLSCQLPATSDLTVQIPETQV